MINLILCGGSGTRLWPVSRSLMPKQFAPLFDGQSLFRKTVKTNSAVCSSQFIVSNADQFFLAKDQLEAEGKKGCLFLLEPVGRNTAPAIALACLTLDANEIVLVSPSDHVIRKKDEYKKVLLRAEELAQAGNLVTFGITPVSAVGDQPLVVGHMVKRDGSRGEALFICLADDPYDEDTKTQTIVFRTNGKKVKAIGNKGNVKLKWNKKGFYTMKMKSNDGVLIETIE